MSLAQILQVEAGIRRVAARMPELPFIETLTLRVATLLGREMSARMDHWLKPVDLTEIEFRALILLFSHGEDDAFPGELCATLAQSPANMTRVSDVLVGRGLMTRIPSEQDRRRMVLRITADGEALVRELLPGMAAFTQELFKDFSPEETNRLLSDLKRVFAALDVLTQYRPAEQS
jgi:MarR family transcriptional repressor of emrRAB